MSSKSKEFKSSIDKTKFVKPSRLEQIKSKEEELEKLKELKKLEDKKNSLQKWADSFNDEIKQKKTELYKIKTKY